MTSPHLKREAAFHRAALLLGLEAGPATVAWAEAALATLDKPSAELIDVAMTPATDLSALRHALALVEEPDPAGLPIALADRAARELREGRRNLHDTFTVLAQLRRSLPVPAAVALRLAEFDNGYLLARARLGADEAEVGAELVAWLSAFDGAEARYFAGPVEHVLELPIDQAGAFVAALSRFLASPAAPETPDPATVWSLESSTGVHLYLNAPAWAAAESAFSPLPPARAESADLRPERAKRVLDSRERRALGRDEVVLI